MHTEAHFILRNHRCYSYPSAFASAYRATNSTNLATNSITEPSAHSDSNWHICIQLVNTNFSANGDSFTTPNKC